MASCVLQDEAALSIRKPVGKLGGARWGWCWGGSERSPGGEEGPGGLLFPVKHSMLSPARLLLQQSIPSPWLPGAALPLPMLCDLAALRARGEPCAPAVPSLMSSAEHRARALASPGTAASLGAHPRLRELSGWGQGCACPDGGGRSSL